MTGGAAVLATIGTLAAAWFAAGAYNAARDQARIAQDALVASTRARLKITAIVASAIRSPNGETVWFTFWPAYKNFGQTPAQGIHFSAHVHVVGAWTGRSAKEVCEEEKSRFRTLSRELVFPQEETEGTGYGPAMQAQEIEADVAKARAYYPHWAVHLGVVACLTYRSAGSDAAHVTGFVGDLHPADKAFAGPENRVHVHELLAAPGGPAEVRMSVTGQSAWAD